MDPMRSLRNDILARLPHHSWTRASLDLVAGCAAAVLSLSGLARAAGDGPAQQAGPAPAETREELEKSLRSERPEKRRAAVVRLAEIGDRPAWELVLRALGDPEPEVADEAQLALGRASDPKLLGELAGERGLRARDPWLRLRVAEALGRAPIGISCEALVRALDPGDAELSRTLLWSIERLHDAGRLGGDKAKAVDACERLVAGRGDGFVRAAALCTLEKLDHFAADHLLAGALSDADPTLRCGAVAVCARATEQECLDLSRRMLADPEPRVRAAAIENLERLESRAAALALVEQMQREPRARLRWGILGWLRSRSGLELGFEPEAWRAWAAKLEGRVHTGEPHSGGGPLGDTHVGFAGLNVLSDRVAFLIDLSGSLWAAKVGERTRKQIVDEQLRKVLQALPSETRFNVIPYTSVPDPWEKRLVPATKDNVARALEHFERSHQTGRGNFFDAARLALLDPEVDTLCVLTDGIPTGGHRWNMGLMTELLVEHDRYRRVAYDSVLVDAPKRRLRDWTALAERTGGRSIAVAQD
jgi:HEAT repeat protein